MSGFTYAIDMDMKSNSDTISKRQRSLQKFRAKKSCPVHRSQKLKYTSEHATREILQPYDAKSIEMKLNNDVKSADVKSTSSISDVKPGKPADVISNTAKLDPVSQEEKRATVSTAVKKLIADMLVGSIENFVVKKDVDSQSQPAVPMKSQAQVQTVHPSLFSPTLRNLSSGVAEPDPPGTHPSLL